MTTNRQYGHHGTGILLTALREPGRMTDLGLDEWDLLLRIARRTRLLGRLAVVMDETGEVGQLPARVRDHFTAARVFVSQHQRTARWEINRILAALEGSDTAGAFLMQIFFAVIGASANVIVAGFAERSGQPIRFLPFMLAAFPLMLLSILVANIYIYLRYL